MSEPTKAQVERFWEWCGIKQDSDRSWRDAGGIGVLVSTVMPDVNLNNLFRYAVPQAVKKLDFKDGVSLYRVYSCALSVTEIKRIYELERTLFDGLSTKAMYKLFDLWLKEFFSCCQSMELALFWAIYRAAGLDE